MRLFMYDQAIEMNKIKLLFPLNKGFAECFVRIGHEYQYIIKCPYDLNLHPHFLKIDPYPHISEEHFRNAGIILDDLEESK